MARCNRHRFASKQRAARRPDYSVKIINTEIRPSLSDSIAVLRAFGKYLPVTQRTAAVYLVDVPPFAQASANTHAHVRHSDISSALFAAAFSSVGWLHALENASVEQAIVEVGTGRRMRLL